MTPAHATICGTATVAQRGQIVIPLKARKQLDLNPGDQLMVFAKDDKILAMIKADQVEQFMSEVMENFNTIKKINSKP